MMLELNSPTLRSRKDIKIEASFDFNDEPSDESKARTSPKIIPRKPRHRAKSPPPGVSKKSSPKSVSSPISSPKSVSTPKGSPKCDSRKNSFEETSSVEEEILLNDPSRKVSFHSTAFVVLIPTIQEYYDAGLAEMLWWNEKDFHGFKTCAASEVKEYMKTVSPHASPSNKQAVKSSMDARKALKLYFQQFFDPKDVSNTKFNQLMLSVQMQQQYEQQQKFLQQQQLLKQQKEQSEKKELPPPPQPAVVEETKTEPPPAAVAPLQIQVENLDSPVVPAQRHDSICGGKPRVQHLHHLSDDQTVLENRNSLNELETEPTMPSLPFPVLSSEATVCKPEGEGSDSLAALKRMMNGVGILSIVLQQN